jgi:hypothetical protein
MLSGGQMQGTISNISVAGMLRLLCNFGKTGVLHVDSANIKGGIEIAGGEIVGAYAAKLPGTAKDVRETVTQLLMAVEEGSFYYEDVPMTGKAPAGICVEDVILESARAIYTDFPGKINISDMLLQENEVLRMARLPRDKKISITFNSAEWNLLLAFNGDMNISAAIEESGVEKKKAEIIMYGLTAAGLVRRLRFKIPEVSKLAKEALGNIGAAIVDNEFMRQKINRSKMGMKDFINLLNGLEASFSEIVGKTKANEIVENIWTATK